MIKTPPERIRKPARYRRRGIGTENHTTTNEGKKKMKKEVYRVIFRNAEGEKINFERFTCKKLDTVKKQMKELMESEIYQILNRDCRKLEYYKIEENEENNKLVYSESVND